MNSPSLLEALLSNSALLTMWGALVLHWQFPIENRHFHPLTIWQHLVETVSEKVNHHHYSQKQLQLSGSLAFCFLWGFAAIILILLKHFVWQQWFFELLLLWFALGWKPLVHKGILLKQHLMKGHKPAARILLSKIVKRETSNLSEIGLAKLGCETMIVGYLRSLICVLFYYAISGGVGAFLYAMLMQMNRAWSTRQKSHQIFGKTTANVLAIVEWLPTRLFALLVATGKNLQLAFHGFKNQPHKTNGQLLWSVIGSKFQIALGGAAFYDEKRIERSKFGGEILPSTMHLILLSQSLLQKSLIWIGLQSLFVYMVAFF